MNIAEPESRITRPSMKERQRQLREDAILDAAVEFLQTKGFNAMTLEDITEAIGISRPTLYQHFSSKEDVLIHVAIRNLRGVIAFIQALDPNRPAIDRIKEFVAWSIDRRFGPNRAPFYDMSRLVLSCGGMDPRYQEPQLEFMTELTSLIEQAQTAGEARNDIRGFLLAESVVGVFKNPALDRHLEQGKTDANEIADCVLKLLLTCRPE